VVGGRVFPGAWWRTNPPRGGFLTLNPGGSLVVNRSLGITPPASSSSVTVTPSTSPPPVVINPGDTLPTASCAEARVTALNSMGVASHWLAGKAVNWRTGDPVAGGQAPPTNAGPFVYAASSMLNVPLPAATAPNMVPNQLITWLQGAGADQGWQQVNAVEAQLLANQCWVVVACWKNTAPKASGPFAFGHIAIVRPDTELKAAEIPDRGPRIVQASVTNSADTYVQAGFPKNAWDDNAIVYLAHKLVPRK